MRSGEVAKQRSRKPPLTENDYISFVYLRHNVSFVLARDWLMMISLRHRQNSKPIVMPKVSKVTSAAAAPRVIALLRRIEVVLLYQHETLLC